MTGRLVAPTLFVALAGVILGSGCNHRCGYTEVRISSTALPDGETRRVDLGPAFMVQDYATADQPTYRIRLVRQSGIERRVSQEFSGIEVRVPYNGAALIVKPFLPVSLVLAFWQPIRQPHRHDEGVWGMADYARDFVAWINPFEAFPSGARELAGDRVVFRRQKGWELANAYLVESAGPAAVTVMVGGEAANTLTTDADGWFTLDLRDIAEKLPAGQDTILTLSAGKPTSCAGRIVVAAATHSQLH
jgi:hypothetical protein